MALARFAAFSAPLRAAMLIAATVALAGCSGSLANSPMPGSGLFTSRPTPQPRAEAIYVASTRPPFRGAEQLSPTRENARFYRQIVTVPPGHVAGTVARPQITFESAQHHFTLGERQALSADAFRNGLAAALSARSEDNRDILVYVHGFNTDYDEAAFRLAQISTDSGFKGVGVLFTWPSYRRVLAYSGDREVATASRDALERMLADLGEVPGAGRIHILAHSMGAFLAMESLRQSAIAGRGTLSGKLGEVMLAAPDLDVEVFRGQVARLDRASRLSLFVQSDDRALAAATTVAWDRQRVGSLNVRNPRHREIMSELGVRVFTMSTTGWTDLVRHGTFSEAPEIVRLIGGKIATRPQLEDQVPRLPNQPQETPPELRAQVPEAAPATRPSSAE